MRNTGIEVVEDGVVEERLAELRQKAGLAPGDDLTLTAEDEAILDRVWEEIRVEDEAKKAARRARRRKAGPGSAPE
jgi:hypothetical protein